MSVLQLILILLSHHFLCYLACSWNLICALCNMCAFFCLQQLPLIYNDVSFSAFLHIQSSTTNATLFFLSIFKTDNNLKNSMANYHLQSMSIFLHYQIRFSCAHARVLAFEYKSAFSVLHVHMLIFLQKLAHS